MAQMLAGASTFGSATAVRLVNNGGTARLVTVIDSVGGLQQLELYKQQLSRSCREKSTEAISLRTLRIRYCRIDVQVNNLSIN